MKKKIGIVILATMMATLVACGNDSKTGSNETSTVAVNNETENNTQENTTDKKQEANADELSDEYLLSLPETSADQFRYEELADGTIKIKGYMGEYGKDVIIVIPAEIEGKKVTEIRKEGFQRSQFKAVVTGANVHTIGEGAFMSAAVEKLVVNGPVTDIESNTFALAQISSISLPNSIETIKGNAFLSYGGKKIIIPESVKLIEVAAFSMASIEELVFEGGAAVVQKAAFSQNSNLKKVFVPACEIKFEEDVFYLDENITIVTPAGSSAEEYAKANGISFETLD